MKVGGPLLPQNTYMKHGTMEIVNTSGTLNQIAEEET